MKLFKNCAYRWVIMAELISWSDFEAEYASNFSETMGAPAKAFRMALGALIIKEKLGTSDRETVAQIRENPYLQYFIGMSSYSNEAPFEASMMVHFRERIEMNLVKKINQKMVKNFIEKNEEDAVQEIKNQGKLLLDATCAPADITYPNDLGILNQARRQTEKRGLSYLKIGLRWLKGVINKGRTLFPPLALLTQDPQPCFASKKAKKRYYDVILFSRIRELKCST